MKFPLKVKTGRLGSPKVFSSDGKLVSDETAHLGYPEVDLIYVMVDIANALHASLHPSRKERK